MNNNRPKKAWSMIFMAVIFSLFLMGSHLPAAIEAAEGDGIIELGEDSTQRLARAAQNPVASMISLPFQNNTNFDFGPREKTQNILNIQPVWPFEMTDN